MISTLQASLIAAQVFFSLSFLFYASWSDYKTREVSNRVWIVYAPIALSLSLANLFLYDLSELVFFGISVGLTVGLAFLLFYSGGFGGADSKALMCIAFALPFAPENLFKPILAGAISPISQFIFPLTIFSNAVLFAAASGIYMAMRNLVWHKKNGQEMFVETLDKESLWKKIIVVITGYKVAVSKLKNKWHIFPMEDIEDDAGKSLRRKLLVVPRDEGRDEIVGRLSSAVEAGKIDAYVWATPGLPMLIFITVGLVVALVFGDMVWLIVRLILG
jgi:preflagellin peptidase FlaK